VLSKIWGVLLMIKEIWEAIKTLLGLVKKVKHENTNKEIDEKTKEAGDPTKPEQERHEATKDLEDIVNRNA
jgi:hypothetical protein